MRGAHSIALVVPLALGGVAACAPHADVDLALAVGDDIHSVLLGIERSDTVEVQAIDVAARDQTALEVLDKYIGRYEVRLTAIEYTATLDELQLAPGRIESVEDGVPLPGGRLRIMETAVHGEDVDPWAEASELPAALAAFRLPGDQPGGCVQDGGCFDRTMSDGTVCIQPCPTPELPVDPTDAALPDFGSCPDAWSEQFLQGEYRVCTPYTGGFPSCPAGEAAFPNAVGCTDVGDPCPSGEWPEGLTGNVVYVRAGVTGGSGTRADPFGSIQDGIQAAAAPATVALSKGRFDEDVTLRDSVTIVGACSKETIVDNTLVSDATFILPASQSVTLRNLQIHGRQQGFEVNGTATLEGVVIRDTARTGLWVRNGGRAGGLGVVLGPNVIRALEASGRSTVILDRVVIDRALHLGVIAVGAEARVFLTDAAIMDTAPDPGHSQEFGRAVEVERGATVDITRGIIAGAHNLAVFVADGAQFHLTDGVIRDTQPRPSDGAFGDALHILRGGQVTLERAWLDENRRMQIYINGDDASASLTDVVVSNSLTDGNQRDGSAVRTSNDALFTARRAAFIGSVRNMIQTDGRSRLELEDVHVIDAGFRPALSNSAAGFRLEKETTFIGNRLLIKGVSGKAFSIYETATATIADVRIEDAGGGTCHVCAGICAHSGGQVRGDRVHVSIGYGRGINASDDYSLVALRDVTVNNGRAAPLCTNSFRSPLKGDGVGSIDGGHTTIERFVIEDNPGTGIVAEDYLNRPGNIVQGVDAKLGIVRRNTVGASILIQDFPVLRVSDRVRYEDNASNLISQ